MSTSVTSLLHRQFSNWREPFSRQKGWLLWAGIGFLGTVTALTGASMSFLSGGSLQTDVLGRLLPLVGFQVSALLTWWASLVSLLHFLRRPCFEGF
ncbi:uncharacterized protein LOC115953857 isoform X2 [Quercus lobata]|uniref:uncharacterized protein LOC115953857 isoform X2 n=1 Tax=Quercus lobata TaxID=97700 RepID=UPI0012494627|nr:uncharacterized protein LOC115953857 isoform X2 [Quercus lobata]